MIRPSTQLHQDGATTGQGLVWDGSKWSPGTVSGGGGGSVPAAVQSNVSGSVTTLTSSSFVEISTTMRATFTASSSGRAIIRGQLLTTPASTTIQHDLVVAVDVIDNTTSTTFISKQVIGGYAYDASQAGAGRRLGIGLQRIISGLTAGDSYTLQIFWKATSTISSGTGWAIDSGSRGSVADATFLSVIPN